MTNNRKEELQKQINQWIYEINGLIKTMKELGNYLKYYIEEGEV